MDEYAGLSPVQRAMVQTRNAHSDTTGIVDGDPHFIIDTVSRKIINNSGKDTLVQFDHNSERLTFELPRYVEGHDMSNCNKITISYLNVAVTGLYEVNDLTVKDMDGDNVSFTWLISSNVTQNVGKLAFAITFECLQPDGKITYSWHTGVNGDMKIISTMVNDAGAVYENIDILEQWKQQLFSTSKKAMKFIQNIFFDSAAAHNAIYRGKYLGDTVTDAQAAAIADGNFNDLYVGDYWTIGGVNYRIADLNYWKGIGNGTKCTTNHVVIVPDTILNTGKINNTATVSGGYINSLMKSKTLNTLAENLPDTLKNRLLTHDTYISDYWMRSSVDLLSERMIYGCKVLSNETKFSEVRQLNLFRMDTERIVLDEHYWLRDVVSNTNFAVVNKNGFTDSASANGTFGIRPVFAIVGK